MRYSLVLAGAALAHFTEAFVPHGRFHQKRGVYTDVEIDYVTVTKYVNAGASSSSSAPVHQQAYSSFSHHHHHISSSKPAASSSSPAAPSSTSEATSASSSPAAPATTSAPSAAPSSTWATSVSSPAPAPSAYSSVASVNEDAPAPNSYGSSAAVSSAAPTSSSKPASTGLSAGNLTPNGKKAGLSGYIGIQSKNAFSQLAPHISWYTDYTANTPDEQGVMGIGMLWGADGSPCGSDTSSRLATYNEMVSSDTVPSIMFGFYEPDCYCPMSADMSTSDAATQWDSLIAPLADKGTVLGSPSMCKQYDEDFLTPFKSAISKDWDVTSIHINKPTLDEAKKDVEYYVSTYNKPIWVSEFACVDDKNGFVACTDQGQIDDYINGLVEYLEGNENVVAYGPSNGEGLGTVWPLTDSNGDLSPTGQTYLNAIKNL